MSSRAKIVAATVSGGALMTMGAFGLVGGGQPATSPTLLSGGMTTGVTVTETTPNTALATSLAVPTVKATFYGKS